jgi:hypothetical protein
MNEAAVDSFQIAIGDTIESLFTLCGVHIPLWAIRLVLVVFNVPLAYIGTLQLKVANLYLGTSLLTAALLLPLVVGLIPCFDKHVGELAATSGSVFGIFSVVVFAVINQIYDPSRPMGAFCRQDVTAGLISTFYNNWDWRPFVVGPVSSMVGMLLVCGCESVYSFFTGRIRLTPKHLVVPEKIP